MDRPKLRSVAGVLMLCVVVATVIACPVAPLWGVMIFGFGTAFVALSTLVRRFGRGVPPPRRSEMRWYSESITV